MLVFLSWSGSKSKAIAEALESWLKQVIQAVEPWISTDIEKGVRWGAEIAERLEKSKIGIICLTNDNTDSRWILFEAGALSKNKDAYVCTLLIGITPADVEQPLAQFQHTTIDKDDIFVLLQTINNAVQKSGERYLDDKVLEDVFNVYWPKLEETINKINIITKTQVRSSRSQMNILEEILELMRYQNRWLLALEKYDNPYKENNFVDGGLAKVYSPEARRSKVYNYNDINMKEYCNIPRQKSEDINKNNKKEE